MKNNYSVLPKIVKENPKMAFSVTRAFTKYAHGRLINYPFSAGKATKIPLVTFKLTSRCNLNCVMCGQRGVKGTLKGQKAIEEEETLVSIDQYQKMVEDLKNKTDIFYVWGGEPFLYPNFMDLAQYMSNNIPVFTVNTNGTHLEENAERIVKDQWNAIFVSLDSFEDINDSIRGKGSFEKVVKGLEALQREKKKQNSSLPYVGIVSTISNLNYEHLAKLAASMKDKGLSWHIINLGTYVTDEIGEEHTEYMKENLDCDAQYWKGFASGYNNGIDGEVFSKILDEVHSIDNGYPIITVPVIRPSKIGEYYAQLDVLVRDKCLAPWLSVNINYNGDVHFCADYPDYITGNIKEENILDIYNNEKSKRFRQELKKSPDGLFPACKRCYQNNLLGHRRRGY